jgi:alanyl-tRNA synthetase
MKADELRKKFIDFFVSKGHKEIPSVSLVPEDDPTILFTPAGMSPLVRYLMGKPHPLGKRLCSVQKCLRTDDIEEVGDLTHFTFFEMLGNWSLGDYFKKQAIEWSFEFLTDKKWLGFDPKKIYISVFKGDKDGPKDTESIKIWQDVFKKVGIEVKKGQRIFIYPKKDNWWGPAGQTGPCGPSTEMFYDTGKPHDKKFGPSCHPNCDCGRFFEFWNDVFMQYNKKSDGSFKSLKQKNVDTGMGLERVVALTEWLEGKIDSPDPYQTHLFNNLINQIEKLTKKKYQDHKREFRIIADHLRAAVFTIADGVEPSNKDRGYIVRRLIRRTSDRLNFLSSNNQDILVRAVDFYSQTYSSVYKELKNCQRIKEVLLKEVDKYLRVVSKTSSIAAKSFITKKISGKEAFKLYSTHGLSPEQLKEQGYQFNKEEFNREVEKHRQISRKGVEQKFAGGLQDQSDQVIKLHTATHLLHAALRKILGSHVQQVGSNITSERLRFDFTHPQALSEKELKQIEDLVNEQIKRNLQVRCQTMSLKEAQKQGALAFFGQRYPDKVKVYCIGSETNSGQPFSLEVCGGPHVNFTAKLGKFKIKKEESCGSGKRRIYGLLV